MKNFAIGDTVIIAAHELLPYVGRKGTVYSSVESAQGLPTHWIQFSRGGGIWVHAEDLRHDRPPNLQDEQAHPRCLAHGA